MATRGWESVTPQDMADKRVRSQVKRSKYHAKKTTVDGVTFASGKEARRYRELKVLVAAGAIHRLILQPRYGLYVRPFVREGVDTAELLKCGDYVGDFQYETCRGAKVVEDVKGMKTPMYRLKKKWVEALYGIQIREV